MKPCECLAMWNDSVHCICADEIGAPMAFDKKAVATAARLAERLSRAELYRERVIREGGSVEVRVGSGDSYYDSLLMSFPTEVVAALITTYRADLMRQLAETGVVSGMSGHRPVLESNP